MPRSGRSSGPSSQVTKGAIYICMSSSEVGTLKQAFEAAGGHWSTFVIWSKNAFTLGRSDYQRQYEPILYGWAEGSDHFWCGARDQGDVWQHDRSTKNDLHPTHEAGRSGRARDPQLVEEPGHDPRPVRWVRHDAHGRGGDRPARCARRDGSPPNGAGDPPRAYALTIGN
jgi:hypothetical protein